MEIGCVMDFTSLLLQKLYIIHLKLRNKIAHMGDQQYFFSIHPFVLCCSIQFTTFLLVWGPSR